MKTYRFEYYECPSIDDHFNDTGIYFEIEVKLTNGQENYNHFINWYNSNANTRGLRKVK